MELVHEDDAVRIERLPGEGRRVVAAFSGIGHGFGGMQRAEFVGTASQGGRNTVLFLTDRRRSWYTAPGVVARMADAVGAELARAGLPACHTIGNSMGGYGAIRLARDMPVAVALAFSPQATMDRRLIDEPRWDEYRPAIVMADHLPLGDCLVPQTRFWAVFGAASRREVAHRNLLPDVPQLTCLMLPGGGHNIVQLLKEADLLAPLVDAMMDDDAGRTAALAAAFAAGIAARAAAAD